MRTGNLIRALALGCTVQLLICPTATAQKGPVPRGGSELPIRITGTIPGYLELSAMPGAAMYAHGPASWCPVRSLGVRVRANTPWTLQARTTGLFGGGTCALRQVNAQAQWALAGAGAWTDIPCEVEHFAGEHDLLLEWALEGSAGAPVLELQLAPLGETPGMTPEAMRSARLAWGPMDEARLSGLTEGGTQGPLWPTVPTEEYTPAVIIRY